MQLRLTRRALEDLGLSVDEFSRQPATDYQGAHAVVRAFGERRVQDPKGQDWTNLPATAGRVLNLHHGRYRGLTWHDEDSDVVWLLGVGWHESGSARDAYVVLKARDESGTLMPEEQDYLDLEMSLEETQSFVAQVSPQAPSLVAQARSLPGHEVRGTIAERLSVGVLVEVVTSTAEDELLEEIWVAFEMPPQEGLCELPAQPEWLLAVLAAMVPVEDSLSDLDFSRPFLRPEGSGARVIPGIMRVWLRSWYGPFVRWRRHLSMRPLPPMMMSASPVMAGGWTRPRRYGRS